MNEAVEMVSSSVLGEEFKTVSIGKHVMALYPPTIRIICRMTKSFSKINMDENNKYSSLSILAEAPENIPHIIKGLSFVLAGNKPFSKIRSYFIRRTLWNIPFSELKTIIETLIPMLGGEDFFVCATSVKQMGKIVAKQKQ